MSTKKELGKIESVQFGHCGYQEAMLGISFTLSGEEWGTCTDMSWWDPNMIKCKKRSAWDEEDRDSHFAKIMRYISDLLRDAKVHSINELQGIPIEVTFEDHMLKDWRILKEIL